MRSCKNVRPTEDLIRVRPELHGRSGTIHADQGDGALDCGPRQEFLVQWEGISRLYSVPAPLLEFGDLDQRDR